MTCPRAIVASTYLSLLNYVSQNTSFLISGIEIEKSRKTLNVNKVLYVLIMYMDIFCLVLTRRLRSLTQLNISRVLC